MNNHQRSRKLKSLAEKNGWEFSAAAESSVIPALEKFEFQTGEKRWIEKIENLIRGANLVIFDVFWYSGFEPAKAMAMISQQDSAVRNIHRQTILCRLADNLSLPKFHVYPLSAFSFVDRWLDRTFRQINFPAYPNFVKSWSVRGSRQAEISEFFDKKLVEFYEGSESFWTLAVDNCVFIYQPNVLIESEQIIKWVERISILSKLIERNK